MQHFNKIFTLIHELFSEIDLLKRDLDNDISRSVQYSELISFIESSEDTLNDFYDQINGIKNDIEVIEDDKDVDEFDDEMEEKMYFSNYSEDDDD